MKHFIYKNLPIQNCYGCRACEQICAYRAISFKENEEGFLYPEINQNLCTDCGACEKVCPTQTANHIKILHEAQKNVYAAWNKNLEERLESTSGGMFYLLAQEWLKNDGIVYGVILNDELHAIHAKIENEEDLKATRGSKYVQSDTNSTYKQVHTDLQAGKRVLYSGTPCQIAGLRLFLRKEYENLTTIDLVCHGTPSPLIFKAHITYIEERLHDKVTDMKFRAKKKTGWRTYAKYTFRNHKPIFHFLGDDFYCHAFHKGWINRKACYTCDFSRAERVGDITLSDFWNSEKHLKELKHIRKHGFNLVMCNTPKGETLLKRIYSKIEKRILPATIAIRGDKRLNNIQNKPEFRNKFYTIYKENGYAYLVENYSKEKSIIKRLIPTWVKNIIKEIQSYI